jgi:hypothetical protein
MSWLPYHRPHHHPFHILWLQVACSPVPLICRNLEYVHSSFLYKQTFCAKLMHRSSMDSAHFGSARKLWMFTLNSIVTWLFAMATAFSVRRTFWCIQTHVSCIERKVHCVKTLKQDELCEGRTWIVEWTQLDNSGCVEKSIKQTAVNWTGFSNFDLAPHWAIANMSTNHSSESITKLVYILKWLIVLLLFHIKRECDIWHRKQLQQYVIDWVN